MTGLSLTAKCQIAAQNNADLHVAIFKAHGLCFKRDEIAFQGVDAPPPYYAQFVATDPAASAAQVALLGKASDQGKPASAVKDSFCQLDADELGMKILLEASWIWREPDMSNTQSEPLGSASGAGINGWSQVRTGADLAQWHEAWRYAGSVTPQTIFPAACLADETLIFLAR